PGALLLFHHGVDLSKGADQRLFADDVLAGLERSHHHGEVEARRRADVDDVDVVHGEDVVELLDAPLAGELVADLGQALNAEVADGLDLEASGIGQVALDDVRAADAAADNGDVEDTAHCSHSVPRSASCCAVSAIFMAL